MIPNVTQPADWNAIAPLTIVAVTALIVLLADLLAPKSVNRYAAMGIAILGLLVAGDVAKSLFGLALELVSGSLRSVVST